jgi:AcrR family transcriptional regulator
MPYPSQIDRETILYTAREMIEEKGVNHLSLNTLADILGVKTPSLYRYIESRTGLLRAVNEETLRQLFTSIRPALDMEADAGTRLIEIARTFRDFAHHHPVTYGLAFTNTIAELQPDEREQEQAVLPFQALMAELSGEADSLAALRGFLALVHGFIMLELANQLRRGGDLDAAFVKSVEAYLAGWQ